MLDPLPPLPELLRSLYEDNTPQAIQFRRHIRSYNSALVFTSVNYTKDTRLDDHQGVQTFRIHSDLYHLQGPLNGAEPAFAQLFFYDSDFATTAHAERNDNLDIGILAL